MITRGTTPTHSFTVDVDSSLISVLYITYKQGDRVVIEKEKADCDFKTDKKTVTVRLTQEDTLKLKAGHKCDFQLRAKTTDEEAVASETFTEMVGDVLKDGVI